MSLEFVVPSGHSVNLELVRCIEQPTWRNRLWSAWHRLWSHLGQRCCNGKRNQLLVAYNLSLFWVTMRKLEFVVKPTSVTVFLAKVSSRLKLLAIRAVLAVNLTTHASFDGRKVNQSFITSAANTLKQVSWWHFLVTVIFLSKGHSGQKNCKKYHILKKGFWF